MTLVFLAGGPAVVTDFRPDGWPLCPLCGADELAAIDAVAVTSPLQIDYCYVCGPIEAVVAEEAR